MTAKGVYALVVEAHGDVEVGGLGTHGFDGRYCYVGSARGPGGLKRLDRHRTVKERGVTRWHVDYLLNHGDLVSAVATETERDAECRLAALVAHRLPAGPEGFGSSDCSCDTHLFGPGDAEAAALDAHDALRDNLNNRRDA